MVFSSKFDFLGLVEVTSYEGRVVEGKISFAIPSIVLLVSVNSPKLSLHVITSLQSFVPYVCFRPTPPSKSSI